MVNELVREINMCLDNGCYMAGLSLALTLPDICGKAIYPELKGSKNCKTRYVKWFDENIGKYEQTDFDVKMGIPYMDGELIYSLRCSVLHEGNPNVNCKNLGIDYFELFYREFEGACVYGGYASSKEGKDKEGNEIIKNKKISINIKDLCYKLCITAEHCYNNNKEKFNFFNYNLVDMDFNKRKLFGVEKRNINER